MSYQISHTLTPDLEKFLLNKYQNSYLCEIFFKTRFQQQGIEINFFCNYSESGSLQDVLVYYVEKKYVKVVNWLLEISPSLAQLFIDAMSTLYPEISCVVWQMTPNRIALKNTLSYVDNSDMCIDLPQTVAEYNSMLGTNSRKLYGKKTRRVERDLEKIVIDEPCSQNNLYMVDLLTDWKNQQMGQRGEKNLVSSDFLKSMLMDIGSVSYVVADGNVACVCLFYKVGKHVYYEQTAYDDKYAWYSLGRVVTYQSIIRFIEQGMTHFHFLWKGADYKNHYAAHEVPLYVSYTFLEKGYGYYACMMKQWARGLLRKLAWTQFGQTIRKGIKQLAHGRTV
ncbi:MAG: GNAT family N-acetyltransferase [Muribaculaceae bacterium]|nr:GNAT family N-acetyltransferase [Muribaculaceae bacterium]